MFCTRCGLKVDEGNRFCTGCGQEVGAAAQAVSPGVPPIVNASPTPGAPVFRSAPPAPVAAPLPYAGFWVRFVAYFIDGLILAIPFWLVVMTMFFLFGGFSLISRMNHVNDPRAILAILAPMVMVFIFFWIFSLALGWLYFAGMESSERQATFGKSAMSLKVTSLGGQRLTFGHATGRFFAKLISGLIPLGIGYIMAGFTEKKQALHDMIAGTLVLRR